MVRLLVPVALIASVLAASGVVASEIRTKGTLDVSANEALVVISTDPVVQRILSEDIAAAKRMSDREGKVLTLTVTVNQRILGPGVSLSDVAPGDPQVASLLRDAGAKAPALTDTGSSRADPYESAARAEARNPNEPLAEQVKRASNYSQMPGFHPDYNPKNYLSGGTGDAGGVYDSAIVTRAVLSDKRGDLTVLALVHPGEDAHEVKKLIAERIANLLLH